MTMSKEEFLQGLNDTIQDMADPRGEYHQLVREGDEICSEIAAFDPVLSQKFRSIITAIEDFGSYVRSRGEFLGGNEGS